MAQSDFFPRRPRLNPMVYAYEDTHPQYAGLLKVGYTATQSVQQRVAQQYPTKRPGALPYRIVLEEPALRPDGTSFTDHDLHRYLRRKGTPNPEGEWFRCTADDVQAAILAVRERTDLDSGRTASFTMRPEQREAVEKTAAYFTACQREMPGKTPHFLWNCKMRFGKTFATYQLARRMGWRRLLVLTFKPAVQSAWEDDLRSHVDFAGWQFVSRDGLTYEEADHNRPIVCFGSFQDFLGRNKVGGIKPRNEWVHLVNWDCVVLDEYHYGAWRENAKGLFEHEDAEDSGVPDYFDEDILPITTGAYLYLSGTPFRAINSGEFIEEQIYNWTYADEQRAKAEWQGADNPYAALPRMVMLTYQLPDALRAVAAAGEFDEFDLNIFFSARGKDEDAEFVYRDEVQKWLDLIRGAYVEHYASDLKQRGDRPPMPYSHAPLLAALTHTLWFLPSVAACHAMRNLLAGSETGLLGIDETETILSLVETAGSHLDIELDLSLARGLNYYTGAIFEVKARDHAIGSICGGGRYDDLTGIFGTPGLSGVGISFGADRIYDVMLALNLFPEEANRTTQVLFANFGDAEARAALPLLQQLRDADIPSEIYPEAAKMKKQLDYANRRNIPYVVLIGENELASRSATVKDMRSGEQQTVPFDRLAEELTR